MSMRVENVVPASPLAFVVAVLIDLLQTKGIVT
jgi:hypothetical protein